MSGTDARAGDVLDQAESDEVNSLVALSQSVATRLSQTVPYKTAFNRVLSALSSWNGTQAITVAEKTCRRNPGDAMRQPRPGRTGSAFERK